MRARRNEGLLANEANVQCHSGAHRLSYPSPAQDVGSAAIGLRFKPEASENYVGSVDSYQDDDAKIWRDDDGHHCHNGA